MRVVCEGGGVGETLLFRVVVGIKFMRNAKTV